MRIGLGALAAALLGGATGCTGLNSVQEIDYHHRKAAGVAVEDKDPCAAAALGVLPGCGSFYTRQYVLGVVDLLLWPASVIWDPFIAYNQAKVINYEVSRANAKRVKQQQLLDLERMVEEKQITPEEFSRRRRDVEATLSFE